jgi:hypothetical protein
MRVIPRDIHLVLDVGHAEYLPQVRYCVKMNVLWDPLHDDTVFEDDPQADGLMRLSLPAEIKTEFQAYDPTWCQVIELKGALNELDAIFGELLEQIEAVPHGDDDTFDYWPSGARLVMQLARDLDQVDEGMRIHYAKRIVSRVLTQKDPEIAADMRDKLDWIIEP